MARWDRILYNGKQYVPAEDYDRVRGALERFQESVWAVQQEAARIDFLEGGDTTARWAAEELIAAISAKDAALDPAHEEAA